MSYKQRFTCVFCILVGCLQPALASSKITKDNGSPFVPNYALANYFGSGIYASGKLAMVNLPLTWEPLQSSKNVYRFRLPLSFGFYGTNMNPHDFDIPDTVNIITFAAGMEFDYWVAQSIKLTPFIDIGLSNNFTDNDQSIVYASGIAAYRYFSLMDEEQVTVIRFQRASFHRHTNTISDGFSSVDTGIDFTLPFRLPLKDDFIFTTLYCRLYWYFLDNIGENSMSHEFGYDQNAQEIGMTFGLKKSINLSLLNFNRIGLGFRYSQGIRSVRLVFGLPLE